MIYTVTLNPSIDYVIGVSEFKNGQLHRTQSEAFFPGGKGNNVSVVLGNLGIESTALGFLAGFTGEKIEAMLQGKGIRTDFIWLPEGNSRINVKMHSRSDAVESEINGCGPNIRNEDMELLMKKLCKLKTGDILVLAGSIPPSVLDDIYEQICARLEGKGVRIIVDAEKALLEKVLNYKPFLIKPNLYELGQLFGAELHTKDEVAMYAEKLRRLGAKNVMVSMAGDGAVFVGEDGAVFDAEAPKGTVINSVGAGDSMVAGFLAGCTKSMPAQQAFAFAVCCGSACAFMQGLPEREDIEKLYGKYR